MWKRGEFGAVDNAKWIITRSKWPSNNRWKLKLLFAMAWNSKKACLQSALFFSDLVELAEQEFTERNELRDFSGTARLAIRVKAEHARMWVNVQRSVTSEILLCYISSDRFLDSNISFEYSNLYRSTYDISLN